MKMSEISEQKNKKKEAATAVETAKSYQGLLKIYQKGKVGTKEYEKQRRHYINSFSNYNFILL